MKQVRILPWPHVQRKGRSQTIMHFHTKFVVETTLIYKEISPHRDMLTKSKIAENKAAMAVVVK